MQECLEFYEGEKKKAEALIKASGDRMGSYATELATLTRPVMSEMNRRKLLRELIIKEADYQKKIRELVRQLDLYSSMCTQPSFANSKPRPTVSFPSIPQDMTNIA